MPSRSTGPLCYRRKARKEEKKKKFNKTTIASAIIELKNSNKSQREVAREVGILNP